MEDIKAMIKGSLIRRIYGRQVFSGRGQPSVEAIVETENGSVAACQCTCGMSIGTHEVAFSYDEDSKWRGKGVMRAVDNINNIIAPALIGMDSANQIEVDNVMLNILGKDSKLKLGGNATGAVSAAVLKAGSLSLGIPLYQHIGGTRAVTLPCAAFGTITGSNRYCAGKAAATKPTYSFIAYDFPSFSDACYALHLVSADWELEMQKRWGLHSRNPSANYTCAGFVCIPPGLIDSDEILWKLMTEIICRRGYENKIGIQVDMASDCFFDKEKKVYQGLFNANPRNRDEQIALCIDMTRKYPFVILEDPLNEEDYEGHAILVRETGVQIVGDDLFTTNYERVRQGISLNSATTVLLKVNQIGTITESLEMIQLAYEHGYGVMPCSSRGENIDICDYSVGINATTIRESCQGAPANRFLYIEHELGSRARFAGKEGIKGWKFQKGRKV